MEAARDSKSRGEIRGGSSPPLGTLPRQPCVLVAVTGSRKPRGGLKKCVPTIGSAVVPSGPYVVLLKLRASSCWRGLRPHGPPRLDRPDWVPPCAGFRLPLGKILRHTLTVSAEDSGTWRRHGQAEVAPSVDDPATARACVLGARTPGGCVIRGNPGDRHTALHCTALHWGP